MVKIMVKIMRLDSVNTRKDDVRKLVVKKALQRIRNYGFINVNEQNIFTDEVYRHYFLKIICEYFGQNIEMDKEIKKIVKSTSNELN